MINLPRDRMDQVVKRFEMLEAQMSAGPAPEAYVRMASEYAELQDMVAKVRELRSVEHEQADLKAMLADKGTDAEMRALAEADLPGVEERIEELQKDIQILLLPRDAADDKNAILEIRAGTGGDEAALFAGDLFRMYERYAAARASLDWIERDLEGSFGTGLYPSGAKKFFGSARADAPTEERAPLLDVTTTSALSVPPLTGPALPEDDGTPIRGDQVRVIYHLEKPAAPEAIGLDLVRYEHRPPLRTELKDASRAVIAHGIASIELRYFDGSSWHEDWDSTASSGEERGIAPRLVETRIRIADPDGQPVELVSAVYVTLGGRRRA